MNIPRILNQQILEIEFWDEFKFDVSTLDEWLRARSAKPLNLQRRIVVTTFEGARQYKGAGTFVLDTRVCRDSKLASRFGGRVPPDRVPALQPAAPLCRRAGAVKTRPPLSPARRYARDGLQPRGGQ